MNTYQSQQFWNDLNGVIGFIASILIVGFAVGMVRSITKPLGNPDTKALPPIQEAKGTCYEDAWRFLIKQEEGELVHGTVESLGKRIGHAWVELPTGYIWEPQTGGYFTIKDFDIVASPIEEHRYTVEEAVIMLTRVGRHGPWTDEERSKWLKLAGSITFKLFDWSTMEHKPAITGYVSHNTSPEKALQILKTGYIKPFARSILFSLDQCFTVDYPSVSFIFPESIIREKYFGKEPEYLIHYPKEEIRRIWETEMEIEVKDRLVYTKDCVEILPGRDTCWKYVYGYKYHYVDVRDRDYYPWKEFRW